MSLCVCVHGPQAQDAHTQRLIPLTRGPYPTEKNVFMRVRNQEFMGVFAQVVRVFHASGGFPALSPSRAKFG